MCVLKRIDKHQRSIVFDCMDTIIQQFKSKRIINFWTKSTKDLKDENINEAYEIFYHCVCMSKDNDVAEYINSLMAINGGHQNVPSDTESGND